MNYSNITNEYYSKWIGCDNILNNQSKGVEFIYSTERNSTQYGYSQQFDLYVFCQPNRIIISYGDQVKDYISKIKNEISIPISTSDIKAVLTSLFGDCITHNVKYVLEKIPDISKISRPLNKDEYEKYLQFFSANNPNCKNTDWVKEYFEEMINENLCCGLFKDNLLVSCTDAPGMPYINNKAQEIGVNTLSNYKGNGYATDVCITAINEIVNRNKCPQWSTNIENISSQKLAQKVGFVKLADLLTITI